MVGRVSTPGRGMGEEIRGTKEQEGVEIREIVPREEVWGEEIQGTKE